MLNFNEALQSKGCGFDQVAPLILICLLVICLLIGLPIEATIYFIYWSIFGRLLRN